MITKAISFQQFKSLGILQIFTSDQNSLDYISGSTAIANNLIEIQEVSDAGKVNYLKIFNLSKEHVFFMDGDILEGVKQNRVLNTSVFLSPNSLTTVPVSCVEQGRWSRLSERFNSPAYISPSGLRARKAKNVKLNLKESGEYISNQYEVWEDVTAYSLRFKVESKTSNLSDVFEKRKNELEGFIKNFDLNEKANGIAVFLNKKLLNVDIFNRTDVYTEYFSKILIGAAVEAYQEVDEKYISAPEAAFKVYNLIDKLEKLYFNLHKSAGKGYEKRFETNELTGFELSLNNIPVHTAVLNL